MSHIFISYSRKDWQFANKLYNTLIDDGFLVWIDKYGIEASDNWVEQIDNALKNAELVILLASHPAIQSHVVRSEIVMADNLKVRVIPLRLEKGVENTILLSARQYIDLVEQSYENAIQALMKTLPDKDRFTSSTPLKLPSQPKGKSEANQPTSINLITDKITKLHPNSKVITIGAVYADITVPDMYPHPFGDGERIIEQIKREVGGSAWSVANYLNESILHGKVHLITAIGDKSSDTNDSEAHFVGTQLQKSKLLVDNNGENLWWFKNKLTATTLIFEDKQRPMLTSPGVISDFNWETVQKQLDHRTDIDFHNNIVFIGGYFKTALYQDIASVFKLLDKQNALIYIDPGRFTWVSPFTIDIETDKQEIIQVERQNQLRNNLQYVDIYSASDSEFRTLFMDIFQGFGRFDILQALNHLRTQPIPLPKVMIIRDRKNKQVFISPGNQEIKVESNSTYISSGSRFDARILSYLYTHTSKIKDMTIVEFIHNCVDYAIGNKE